MKNEYLQLLHCIFIDTDCVTLSSAIIAQPVEKCVYGHHLMQSLRGVKYNKENENIFLILFYYS
jgi:hypothetical protein